MLEERRKESGIYFTPPEVVRTLVSWAVRTPSDRLLDPSCGNGGFLAKHRFSVGVEQDLALAAEARQRAPWALVHEGDFFVWASKTEERFECAAGNPPFIRYQRFTGDTRHAALKLCEALGATFSSLTSSWAPFLVATASLLKPGGRLAFVLPAEVGHAPYARPLINYLTRNFTTVSFLAIREKVFTELSEDVWLLFAEGFGGSTQYLRISSSDSFSFTQNPPQAGELISLSDWERWNYRLRPFLAPRPTRDLYQSVKGERGARILSDVARVGIGYVTGDNEFFHLRPSQANFLRIPPHMLLPSVRGSRLLTNHAITNETVNAWRLRDDPFLLLRIQEGVRLPASVLRYLDSPAAQRAKESYKCRTRSPWYVVPDVTIPDGFLSYMSNQSASLVRNDASCVCTNTLHTVKLTGEITMDQLQRLWNKPFTQLSCELEGHPLGGGMLKLEPREAQRVVLSDRKRWTREEEEVITEGLGILRAWRHSGG